MADILASSPGRPASSPFPYLLRHRSALLFRIRVPADIQACLGQKEYRRSLGPSYVRSAKLQSLRLAAAALEVFDFTRAALSARTSAAGVDFTGGDGYTTKHSQPEENRMNPDDKASALVSTKLEGRTLGSLTDEEIRAIAAEWLLLALKGQEVMREALALSRRKEYRNLSPEQVHIENKERAESDARARGLHTAVHKSALAQREFSHIQPQTDSFLSLCGIQATGQEETRQYVKACEELTKAKVTLYKMQDDYAEGNFTDYDNEFERAKSQANISRTAQKQTATSITPNVINEDAVKLSDAIEEMFKEKRLGGAWRPKVEGMEKKKFELLQAVIDPNGDMLVSDIRAKHIIRYKEILHLMPANKGKKPEYRDLPLSDLIALVEAGNVPEELRMEPNTIKTYCQSATTFINWAAKREYLRNPSIAANLHVKAEKQAHEYRDPYTNDDISRLFAPAELNGQDRPSRFWIPLLGLFTGARLEELAQLHTDDIVFVNSQEDSRPAFVTGEGQPIAGEDETLCLFINKGKPFQRLKNVASRRFVPLSSVLAQGLGFMAYALSVFQGPAAGDGRLFPELTRKKETDNFAHSVSKWFNTHRTRAGVIPRPGAGKKDFHSFRHTVARWCEQNSVPEKAASRFLGHSHDTMTFGRYGSDTAARILYQKVAHGYGEYLRGIIDFDKLKDNRWTGGGGGSGLKPAGT